MNSTNLVNFTFNYPQARFMTALANQSWLLWSRATGKTSGAIAPWKLHKVSAMPRSSGGLVGTSFEDLETRILKGIFTSFSIFGLEEGEHYTYGKRPPADWDKPFIPVIKYDHVLSFPNGTSCELISLSKMASANALNLQWLVGDEVKFFNEQKFNREVAPILGRGNLNHPQIAKSPWYGSLLMVTDKLSPSIHWLLAKKKLMNEGLVNTAIFYQLRLNELRIKLSSAPELSAPKLLAKISEVERILAFLRMDMVYFSEANAHDNAENLTPNFFTTQRSLMTDFEYRIQILNEDPTRVENGFYPARTDVHLYDKEQDEDPTQPLGVALDYQVSISPLVAFQINDLVTGNLTLNFLHSFYVLQPLGLKHVVDKFCEHYKNRPCKKVYFYYDQTAIAERNMHNTVAEEVVSYFKANGWSVTEYYMGRNPSHVLKFNKINGWLENELVCKYPIRIHKHRCATMVMSMDLTGTKDTEEGTKKDKGRERDKNYPQEQATHFSDVFDMSVWGVLELNYIPKFEIAGGSFAFR